MKFIAALLLVFASTGHAVTQEQTLRCFTTYMEPGFVMEISRLFINSDWHGAGAEVYTELPDGTRINQQYFGGNADTTERLADGKWKWSGRDLGMSNPDVLTVVIDDAQTNVKKLGSVDLQQPEKGTSSQGPIECQIKNFTLAN